jgi:hypothetical protein
VSLSDPGGSRPDADAPDPALLARTMDLLAAHLEGPVAAEPWVQAVEHDPSIPRWYVRFGTDTRDAATIYFEPRQRSLHYEVYFLPDPPAGHAELYGMLLRANHSTLAAHFSIGPDGDLYLVGRTLLEHLDESRLDGILGELYALTERWFAPAVQFLRRR